jgi:DNA polymerase III alpha subunit
MSQRPGGLVLTHDRLDDLVPIQPAAMDDREIIEWDKDDIDALKFMKVDVPGLGVLGCMVDIPVRKIKETRLTGHACLRCRSLSASAQAVKRHRFFEVSISRAYPGEL